jgi:ribonuclease Z
VLIFFCREGELKLNTQLFIEEAQYMEGFPEILAELKQRLIEAEADATHKFPQVVFLGTGSCIPNETRNTSGILIHTRYDTGTFCSIDGPLHL